MLQFTSLNVAVACEMVEKILQNWTFLKSLRKFLNPRDEYSSYAMSFFVYYNENFEISSLKVYTTMNEFSRSFHKRKQC